MSKKKVTAPLTYDPGKGRPKEHLAYLNWQEMQALKRLNGNNQERGPMGLPSFPPGGTTGKSSAKGTTTGKTTTKSSGSGAGPRSGMSGTRSPTSGSTTGSGKGPSMSGGSGAGRQGGGGGSRSVGGGAGGATRGAGPRSGVSGSRSPTSGSTRDSGKGPSMSGPSAPRSGLSRSVSPTSGSKFSSSGNKPAGFKGPDSKTRSLSGADDAKIKGAIEGVKQQAYKPSPAALKAITRGPGSVSGMIPGNTDPVAMVRSLQGITNARNETLGDIASPSDVSKMARAIAGEAIGEDRFGRAAVANTMINRIQLGMKNPDKYGYLGGQNIDKLMSQYDATGMRKGTVANAAFKNAVPGTAAYQAGLTAINDALNPRSEFSRKASPTVLNATHYYNPKVANPKWGQARSGKQFEAVGNHLFGSAENTERSVAGSREKLSRTIAQATPTTPSGARSASAAEESVRRAFAANKLGAVGADPAIKQELKNALSQSMWDTRIADSVRMAQGKPAKGAFGEVSPVGGLSGFRSLQDQADIPSQYTKIKDPAKSYHTWGMAMDVAPERLPGESLRSYNKRVGDVNAEIAKNIADKNVNWGGAWKGFSDPGHFQYGSGSVNKAVAKYGSNVAEAGVRPGTMVASSPVRVTPTSGTATAPAPSGGLFSDFKAAIAPAVVRATMKDEVEAAYQKGVDAIKSAQGWMNKQMYGNVPEDPSIAGRAEAAAAKKAVAAVSPSQDGGLTADQEKELSRLEALNRFGLRGIFGIAGVGTGLPIGPVVSGYQKLRGQKDLAGQKADLVREYASAAPDQKAKMEKANPELIDYASRLKVPSVGTPEQYDKWAQERGLRTVDSSNRGIASLVPRITETVAPAPTESTTGTKKAVAGGPRPPVYYQWDLGVNIPSPSDPNYTQYQTYLAERAAAQAAMYG